MQEDDYDGHDDKRTLLAILAFVAGIWGGAAGLMVNMWLTVPTGDAKTFAVITFALLTIPVLIGIAMVKAPWIQTITTIAFYLGAVCWLVKQGQYSDTIMPVLMVLSFAFAAILYRLTPETTTPTEDHLIQS